jgi:enoyl-CoA hydratase/carnithine racemase
MGTSVLLPRLIAQPKAFAFLLNGTLFSGSVAKEHGLVLQAVSAADVLPRALALAESLSLIAPIAIQTHINSLRVDKVRVYLAIL